jgi:uncharacterized protein YuzE
MKLEFDPQADAAYLEIAAGEVEHSEQITPGVIVDFDAQGDVVGIEILSVSKRGLHKAPLREAA